MQKKTMVSAEKLAAYILKRQQRNDKYGDRKEERIRSGHSAAKQSITKGLDIERGAAELTALIAEKEDLLRQVAGDALVVQGNGVLVSQDGLLEAIDGLEDVGPLDLRNVSRSVDPLQGIVSSMEQAKVRLGEIRSRIERLTAIKEVASLYEKRVAERIETIRAARQVEALERLTERTDVARLELLTFRNRENSVITGADNEILKNYDTIKKKALDRIRSLMENDDVYYEARRRALLVYRSQFLRDGFVETKSIKSDVMQAMNHLKLGIPVLLRGHLGAGKTEMALHIARDYLGCEPEFISGSEESTKYDIYGKTQIGVRSEEQRVREFSRRLEEFCRMNPGASKKELRETENRYYQEIVVKGLASSFFQYGPLVMAMKEGKPLIIDEMDGIPHSIIMRLNHVLTRRPGDVVKIEENEGDTIIVRKGFCVMATGNIKSARYKREDLDAAFLSRWWSQDIKYPPENETYEILIASLLDKRGDLQVKDHNDLDALKRLTQAASEIQRIFAGEEMDYFGEGADAAREIPASLKKSVLSLRHLWNIVSPWKANNFDRPIDSYLFHEFIKPAVVEDQIYLIQLCCRFRFFKEWKAADFGIPGLTDAKVLAFQGRQALPSTE